MNWKDIGSGYADYRVQYFSPDFSITLGWLKDFVQSQDSHLYLPEAVATEIQAKSDQASLEITQLIDSRLLQVKGISLRGLANHLNQRLGKGEAEAMVLGIELQTDYLILDDAAARREALRLGLTVKVTLAILKTMANLAFLLVTTRSVVTRLKPVGVEALAGGPAATTFNGAPTPTG